MINKVILKSKPGWKTGFCSWDFCPDFFGHVGKRQWEINGKQIIKTHTMPNIQLHNENNKSNKVKAYNKVQKNQKKYSSCCILLGDQISLSAQQTQRNRHNFVKTSDDWLYQRCQFVGKERFADVSWQRCGIVEK